MIDHDRPISRRSAGIFPGTVRTLISDHRFVGILVFLILLIMKWEVLTDPPVWDAAMGTFPAAITLSDSGFDYPGLLAQPGFIEGGPNSHATSAYTLVVAILITLMGAQHAFVALHLLSFVAAGVTAQGLMRLMPGLSRPERLIATVVALSMPLLVTQFSLIYLSAPLLAATALALANASEGRVRRAAIWALVATAIKPTGIIAAATAAAMIHQQSSARKRTSLSALVLVPALAVALATAAYSLSRTSESGSVLIGAFMAKFSLAYLLNVPDVLVLLLVGLLSVAHLSRTQQPEATWLGVLLLSFIAAYLIPLYGGFAILPRYYTQILPFVVVGALLRFRRQFGQTVFWGVAALLLLSSMANSGGRFYPDRGNANFAAVERSSEYRDLLMLHQEISRQVSALDPSISVYYGLPEHYRQSFPAMGYIVAPHPNGTFVSTRDGLDLESLPDRAYLLLDLKFRGGIAIDETYHAALDNSEWSVTTTTIRRGEYTAQLAYLERTNPR